jgi:hypothetical protein
VARKAPSPQKQVKVAFGLLIKDTKKLPKRAAKKALRVIYTPKDPTHP